MNRTKISDLPRGSLADVGPNGIMPVSGEDGITRGVPVSALGGNAGGDVFTGSFTDPRDNRTYRTVKIGNTEWFAENFNLDVPGSGFYDNDPAMGDIYGRLYTWQAAMDAAPDGWRLPAKGDWGKLVRFAGGSNVAGGRLKATTGWAGGGNGTDDYGFSALPGGIEQGNVVPFTSAGSSFEMWLNDTVNVNRKPSGIVRSWNSEATEVMTGATKNSVRYVRYHEDLIGPPDFERMDTVNRLPSGGYVGGEWVVEKDGYVRIGVDSAVAGSSTLFRIYINYRELYSALTTNIHAGSGSMVVRVNRGDLIESKVVYNGNPSTCFCYFIPPIPLASAPTADGARLDGIIRRLAALEAAAGI